MNNSIKRRDFSNPIGTMVMFLIPTASYIIGKLTGTIVKNEWLWPIAIGLLFILWLIVNFKFVKNNNQ
jgi:hypothetical protein